MSTLRHGEKDILSSPPRLRVVYCSFVSKDQDNEKPVRYEMSSVTNQKNIRSEIVMNDLHLGDNPFLHNGGSDQDHTYFSVNSEMLETCDASEDLFQYMRHRSLVLEVWIDRERREDDDEEEDTTVLVGLAHVDLSELVSFSENRNVPSVVEWKRGSVEDPMTGAVVGTVRGIVALGYSNQLKMIRKIRDTTSRLKRCAQRWLSERRIVVTKRRASDGQDVKETQESSKITDFQSARSPSSPEKDVSSSDFSSSSSSPSPVSNTNWMESLVDTVGQVLRDQETSSVITREHVVTVSIENSFQENDDDDDEEMWGTYVRYTYGGTRHILWWDRDKSLNTKSRHSASYSMTRNICVSPVRRYVLFITILSFLILFLVLTS